MAARLLLTLSLLSPVFSSITNDQFVVLNKVLKYYHPDVMPKALGSNGEELDEPTKLNMSLVLTHFRLEDFKLQVRLDFKVSWLDPRLHLAESRHSKSAFLLPASLKVWTPTMGFAGLETAKSTIIFDTIGYLTQTIKFSGSIPCLFDTFEYPLGKEKCRLQLIVNEDDLDLSCNDPCFTTNTAIQWFLNVTEPTALYVDFEHGSGRFWALVFRAYLPSTLLVLVLIVSAYTKRRTVRAVISGSALLSQIVLWMLQDKGVYLSVLDLWFCVCLLVQVLSIAESLLMRQSWRLVTPPLSNSKSSDSVVISAPSGGSVTKLIKQKTPRISLHSCCMLVLVVAFATFALIYMISVLAISGK